MQSRARPGPTMSPRTAPASTDASCSGSPTRISRASGRTASTSRAIMRERHHGGLVDDDHVVGQRVGAGCAGSGSGCRGLKPEQPVQRRARAAPAGAPRPRGSTAMVAAPRRAPPPRAGPPPCPSARPGRSSGGRAPCSCRPARRAAPGRGPRSSSCPVPGPPAMTETRRSTAAAAARRCRSRIPPRRLRGTDAARPARRAALVDVHHGGLAARCQQVRRHQDLVGPEPVEVQVGSRQVQRAVVADQRARGHALEPGRRIGPGQCVEIGRRVGVAAAPSARIVGQVHADVAEARRAGGEGERRGATASSVDPTEPRQAHARRGRPRPSRTPARLNACSSARCAERHVAASKASSASRRSSPARPWSKRSLSARSRARRAGATTTRRTACSSKRRRARPRSCPGRRDRARHRGGGPGS